MLGRNEQGTKNTGVYFKLPHPVLNNCSTKIAGGRHLSLASVNEKTAQLLLLSCHFINKYTACKHRKRENNKSYSHVSAC